MQKILVALSLLLLPLTSFAQSLTFTWDDMSDNEDGFHCERQANGGTFAPICEVGANVKIYRDTTVKLNVPYCYRVRAYNDIGPSAYSNIACKTLTADAPNAVLNLTSATIPEIVQTGLVLSYSFNEGSGTAVKDASGKNNNGTISGAIWGAGKDGGALSFDGENDIVSVPDSASLDVTTGVTLEGWVYPTEGNAWRTVLIKTRAGDLVYALYTSDGSNHPSAILYIGTTKQYLDGPNPLPLNTWSHLAVTYNGAQYRLYVNGVQVAGRAQTGKIVTSTGVLQIGSNTIWGEPFAGQLDSVRIYNRALSPAEIQADLAQQ